MTSGTGLGVGAPRIDALARWAIALLALTAFVDLWAVVAELHRASLMSSFDPATTSLSSVDTADHLVRGAAGTQLLLLLATAGVFIAWLYRLVKRMYVVRRDVYRRSPGWAIGSWFIPFVNLVWPKQFVDDSYRATEPLGAASARPPVVAHFWWGIWLVANFLSWTSARADTSTASKLATADRVSAVADVLDLVAAVLAIVVVAQLSRRAAAVPAPGDAVTYVASHRFNPPPGWPAPPPGWTPPPGWQPDPSWPAAPEGWSFWLPQ